MDKEIQLQENQQKKKSKTSIFNRIKYFIKDLHQEETRLLKILNFLSIQKIVALIMAYKAWIDIAKIGFNNVYSIFTFDHVNEQVSWVINKHGSLLFNSLLSILLFYSILKMVGFAFSKTDNYINNLLSLKKLLSGVLRLGTVFIMVAIYKQDIELNEISGITSQLLTSLIVLLLVVIFEKVTLLIIRKSILRELEYKKCRVETKFGVLKNVPLLVLKNESNWNTYISRVNVLQEGSLEYYDQELYESFVKSGVFTLNQKIKLNKTILNYEIYLKKEKSSLPGKQTNENIVYLSEL